MSDPMREVMRSPIEESREPRVKGRDILVVFLALVVGVAAGWIIGQPDDAETTTTIAIEAAPEPRTLPDGFVDTGLGYAVGASWMYSRGDDLLIGMTVAHPADGAPKPTGGTILGPEQRGVALWTVELSGGERVEHTRELFDQVAPGVITIEFAGIGARTDDVRNLSFRPVVGSGSRTHQVSVPIEGLPAAISSIEPLEATELVIATDDGTERTDLTWISVDDLTIDWSNASLSWSLDRSSDVRVGVEPVISVEGDTTEPIQLQAFAGAAFLQRIAPPVAPTAAGTEVLRKVAGATRETYSPERADLTITVWWLRYAATSRQVPLDAVTSLGAVE